MNNVVIPAQAGIQTWKYLLDSGLRRNDGGGDSGLRRNDGGIPVFAGMMELWIPPFAGNDGGGLLASAVYARSDGFPNLGLG